jgi:hypothetical protein
MIHECILCNNINCEQVLQKNNLFLARYGLLEQPRKNTDRETDLSINLIYCDKCNFAWNAAFNQNKVKYDSDAIIESGTFSKRYMQYQREASQKLNDLINSKIDTVVEIGAGSGIFINEIKARKKIAIEPSQEATQIDKSIEVHNEYFTREKFNLSSDLIISRQVLEHVENPKQFVLDLISSFGGDPDKDFYIYLEVPNTTNTFKQGRFYDYYYEHCNYFTEKSLIQLCSEIDLTPQYLDTAMDGELVSILMKRSSKTKPDIQGLLNKNHAKLENKIRECMKSGKKLLAWGASGNGVQILNDLQIDTNTIEFVIDSDKNKQGKYVPGTHQKIISPSDAIEISPDSIIVLTQFHKKEIIDQCKHNFEYADVWFV